MKKILKEIANSFIQLYTWGAMNELGEKTSYENSKNESCPKVAAGDPTLGIYAVEKDNSTLPISLDYNGTEIHTNEFMLFKVEGLSMSPEGILNGDILLCKTIKWENATDFKLDKYIIIDVDKDYYKWKKKNLKYAYKIRKTLMHIPAGCNADEIISSLKETNDDIFLSENQKCLKEKLKETRQYYKDIELCLSITYKEGNLRYSFHPINLVKAMVYYKARHNGNNNWSIEKI